jgi:hypothetical protein
VARCRRGLLGTTCALAVTAAACSQTQPPPRLFSPKTTVTSTTQVAPTTTTTAPFAMEPCGGIVTNTVSDPPLNLQPFLLTSVEVPSGYTTMGTQVTTGTNFVAAVPSTVPVAYITFQKGMSSTATNPTSAPTFSISEAVGSVESSPLATQLAARIVSAEEQPQCLGSGGTISLSVSGGTVLAFESSGSSSADSNAQASVIVAKGPYVINVAWNSQVVAPSEAPPPASNAEMASIVDVALSRIPG